MADGKDTRSILTILVGSHPWLANKYSSRSMLDRLEEWRTALLAEASESGLSLHEEEIFSGFKASYLRFVLSGRKKGRMKSRIVRAVEQIKKKRILARISQTQGKEEVFRSLQKGDYGVQRLVERTRLWEDAMRAFMPEISSDEVFKFFKIRYLGISNEQFRESALQRGIQNTLTYLQKKSLLRKLFINSSHPQYDQLIDLAFWRLQRRYNRLMRAVKACNQLTVSFPSCTVTQRELKRFLRHCGKTISLKKEEEMLLKLVTQFQGMTLKQLKNIHRSYLLDNRWQPVAIEKSMDTLVDLRLLEREDFQGHCYYIPTKREIWIEKVLEDWIARLRQDISIGTGEALNYLNPSFSTHTLSQIEKEDIPSATQKIWEDRGAYLKRLFINKRDPLADYLLGRKKAELDHIVNKLSLTINAHNGNTLSIPQELQQELSFYMGQELSDQDVQVFKLVYNLNITSYEQLGNIFKKANAGRIGFCLGCSLKRLCEYALIDCSKQGVYQVRPPQDSDNLRDLPIARTG